MGGPNGITLTAWLLLSPIAVFLTSAFVPEGLLPGANPWLGVLVGLISHLVTGLVLLLAKFTILRNTHKKSRPITTLSVFALAGLARGFSVAWGLEVFGITAQADYEERMRAGAVIILIWFAVCAVMVDGIRNYRETYAELTDKFNQVRLLREQGAKKLKNTQQELTEQIRVTISEALRAGSSSSDIHRAVDSLVRPLSHRIQLADPQLGLEIKPPRRRLRLLPVLRTAVNEVPFNPLWVIAMSVLGTLSSRFWQVGPAALIDSVAIVVIITAFFQGARRLKLKGYWTVPVWFLTGISVSAIPALIAGSLSPESFSGLILLSLNVVGPAAIVSSIGAFDREAKRNLEKLEGAVSMLQWQSSSLEQRDWVQRQRISRFVHSELQSRLRAFALRMGFAGREPSEAELLQLRLECDRSLLAESRQQDFSLFLDDIRKLWEGVLDIEVIADQQVLDQLAQDPYCSAAAIEVVREAFSNAVRHGKANKATLRLSLVGSESEPLSLNLEVLDNGILQAGSLGFGLKTIAELSFDFELSQVPSGTCLSARLTLAPELVKA